MGPAQDVGQVLGLRACGVEGQHVDPAVTVLGERCDRLEEGLACFLGDGPVEGEPPGDALRGEEQVLAEAARRTQGEDVGRIRSEEHTSELQSLMRISYAVLCLKKKK